MTIEIRTTKSANLLPVHAQPGTKRSGIIGEHSGRLKIAVTQVAEKGKANAAIIKLLSQALGISQSQIALQRGETAPLKVFSISGLTQSQLVDKVQQLLEHNGP